MIDRFKLLTLWIDSPTVYGASLRESLQHHQFLAATEKPILEDRRSVWLVRKRTWLGPLCAWMAENHIIMKGTPKLPGGTPNDVALADLGDDENECQVLREGCNKYNVFWVSQLMCGPDFRDMSLQGARGIGRWGILISARIRKLDPYPSEEDRAAPGCVMQGDIAARGYWSHGWFRVSICHVISCVGTYASVKDLTGGRIGSAIQEFYFSEWPRAKHSTRSEVLCSSMELVRLPCDQSGPALSRIDTTRSFLRLVDRALRSRQRSPQVPALMAGPPHPLLPFLRLHGISPDSLRPFRMLAPL